MAEKSTGALPGSTPSGISPSGQAIAYGVNLLTEILLRLPAKTLIDFKSVSKHWLSLISHPQFASNHSTRNPTPSISGFYFYSDGRLSSVSLHGRRNLPSVSFLDGLEGKNFPATIHSCNGLLLFNTPYVDRNGYLLPLYIVCNPTTNKHTVLPKTGFSSRLASRRRGPYLAFDPSKSPHYKVVVVSLYRTQSFEIDVYSSETRSWKNIEIDVHSLGTRDWINIFFPGKTSCSRGVFWNGALHWLGSNNSLLKFDVDAEKMLTFPLPQRPTLLPRNNISYLGECGGGLILVRTNLLSIEICRILELEGDNIHWIENYRVDLRTIVAAFLEIENDFKYSVLCVFEGEEKGDYSLVLAIPGKVISYNLNCNKFDELCDLVPGELIDHGENGFAYPFVETLSPV